MTPLPAPIQWSFESWPLTLTTIWIKLPPSWPPSWHGMMLLRCSTSDCVNPTLNSLFWKFPDQLDTNATAPAMVLVKGCMNHALHHMVLPMQDAQRPCILPVEQKLQHSKQV